MIESLDQRGCPYMADSTAQNLGSDTKAHILLICALVSEPKMTIMNTNFLQQTSF